MALFFNSRSGEATICSQYANMPVTALCDLHAKERNGAYSLAF